MVQYIVTFSVATKLASLAEISRILGTPNDASHNQGESPEGFWADTEWQIDSQVEEFSSLEEHLHSLWEKIEIIEEQINSFLPEDAEKSLVIAAFYDDAMCSVYLLKDCLAKFNRIGCSIEVSCYPSVFD